MRRALVVTVVSLVAGCNGDEDGTLFVELRTNLAAGSELGDIETRVDTRAPIIVSASVSGDYARGERVAELGSIASGPHEVRVTLLSPAGDVLGYRDVTVTVDGPTALLVILNRGCVGLDRCTWEGVAADAGLDATVPADASVADAGPSDAGPIDAGPRDVGVPDAGCAARDIDGVAYLYCPTNRSWASARSDCMSWGYHLTDLEDEAEAALVQTEAEAIFATASYWIGLNDTVAEGTYVWSDGTEATYTAWGPGEPNNFGGEDCILVTSSGWADQDCSASRNFVCEHP